MLSKLTIKNVALIDSAEIVFSKGLNVLSGETGAGKSVILDSVNFVLGAKADKTMIRHNQAECLVKAEFIVPEESEAVAVLREMDVDTDGEIILSRKFNENGKGAIKINGETVTAAMLKRVTPLLVDVHGQSEHFFLLSESNQLNALDKVSGERILEQKDALRELIDKRRDIDKQMSMLGGDEEMRARRLDVLKFQIDEIESADLVCGEEEELVAKRNKIHNLEKIILAIREASAALSSDGGVLDCVRLARRSLNAISSLDNAYSEFCDRLENLSAEAQDVADTISSALDELYFDEGEAEQVERRLDLFRSLKRKYGADIAAILEFLEKCKQEYDLLSDCEGKFAQLNKEKEKVLSKIFACCKQMTEIRKDVAKSFCAGVTNELKTLNIPSARFEIEFDDYSLDDAQNAGQNGLDCVRFMFSANAGEPLKPLGKIISGGEMSRFMLAVKTFLSGDVNGISTYVFDEIDAGISGKTAKVVGEKFARIAKDTQIIAVSHLAQIAAMSDSEFLIEKIEENGKTCTCVRALDEQSKKQEIVRLLGGQQGDEFAFKHAEELISAANAYKNSL